MSASGERCPSNAGIVLRVGRNRMLTFRVSLTAAVLAFVTALAACLISIQIATFHAAARSTAAAAMDAASGDTLRRIEARVAEVGVLLGVLSNARSLGVPVHRGEDDDAVVLFKSALRQVSQTDTLYVGYENGSWLQVRRLDTLTEPEREILRAPPTAAYMVNLIQPAAGGSLPLLRVFEDATGQEIGRLDLPAYGYDPRRRPWYADTMQGDRPLVSSPYISFTIGTPVITVSAPLRGDALGVIAADLKLDAFSALAQAHRPGEHGEVVLFDSFGVIIAQPGFTPPAPRAAADPSEPELPDIGQIRSGRIGQVMRRWDGEADYQGDLRDAQGRRYLFVLKRFADGDFSGYSLLLADEDDFAGDVRRLQTIGLVIALVICACFVPAVWIFADRMSMVSRRLTEQAGRLQNLAAPDPEPITSRIVELHELGRVLAVAQRAIWSFARFVPKEIVGGILDGSIATELGGARQEVTVLFTDVQNFTGIAEAAEPDRLMHQTSRHFAALTEAFLAEGGTVDKFIGDGAMVVWNAPRPQPDHVERACRAALAAKAASDALNRQFAAEGLPAFAVRVGIHCGDAVVGNLGSTERMEYTALGNTVNLASRLEGLNKDYGTAILVSRTVRDRAVARFHFRAVASVTAKGMSTPTRVYELLGAIG
jgi:adenylate cyclase